MSLRLLVRLADLSARRLAANLAISEQERVAAAGRLAELENCAVRQKPGTDHVTMATDPLWHLRLGEKTAQARSDLARVEAEVALRRKSLGEAYAQKLRYEKLFELRQLEEVSRRAGIEQRDLDEYGQRLRSRFLER